MVCGFCGTEIRPGFGTCPQCGAMFKRRLGCLGEIFMFLATAVNILLFFGGIGFVFTGHLPFALVLWAAAAVIFGIAWRVLKRANRAWVRLGPRR